jgi:hypothetical protein
MVSSFAQRDCRKTYYYIYERLRSFIVIDHLQFCFIAFLDFFDSFNVWLTCRRCWRDEMARNHFFYQMAAASPRQRRSGGAGVGRMNAIIGRCENNRFPAEDLLSFLLCLRCLNFLYTCKQQCKTNKSK